MTMSIGGNKEIIMAKRPVFISNPNNKDYVDVKNIEFEWHSGFSIKQKQKSMYSLHEKISENYPTLKVLEISSKSNIELGVSLSAFNLMIKTKRKKEISVETAFQASKVFENGGPFVDLFEKTSKEAKKDKRLKNSGRLIHFQFFSRKWGLEPKTLFYDWLYLNTLVLNEKLSKEVLKYDAFTDIEFNPEKSVNCQARSVALYVSLYKSGNLHDALSSEEMFKKIAFDQQNIKKNEDDKKINHKNKQINIFDL